MSRTSWQHLFGRRARAHGELDTSGVLFVGDPLTGDLSRFELAPGRVRVELALDAMGNVAIARALCPDATPSSHRALGSIVVDSGIACFASEARALTEPDRELLIAGQPEQLGAPPWLSSFGAGGGDGVYRVFAAYEDERVVGIWIDFALVELSDTKPAEPKWTDAAYLALFDALEDAVQRAAPLPDLSPLDNRRRRKVNGALFPRLARLLDADPLPDAVAALARTWLEFPEFQRALASSSLQPRRWQELHADYRLFLYPIDSAAATALAHNPSLPRSVRLALGEPRALWEDAASTLDAAALDYFARREAADAAPNEESRLAIEQALLALSEQRDLRKPCYRAIENLRRHLPPRIPR